MRLILALLATLGLAAPAGAGETFELVTKEPEPVPAISFTDRAGNEATLERYRGRLVVLNLWATWCVPCREEMPALDRLQAAVAKDNVTVVALAVDRGGAQAVDVFLAETPVEHLDVVIDQSARSARQLRAPGLPTTLVIDREGREIARVLGLALWDSDAAIERIRELAGS
jgi:thiol-disulfide isomerase/thioredoxin